MTKINLEIFEYILKNNGSTWMNLQKKFTQGSVNNFFKTFAEKPIIYNGEKYLLWEDHSIPYRGNHLCMIYVTLREELMR